MKRFIALLVLAVSMFVACTPQAQFYVYNDCIGSWMVVRANGQVRNARLSYGQSFTLDVSRIGDGQVLLTADGFSQTDDHPLGSATDGPFYISNSSGQITGPTQASWQITYLTTTDIHGGCQNH
jgi:hypothetical protein